MSHTLRTAALVVGSVALIATGVGAALGSAGVATALGMTATEAVVATATVATVASYAEIAAIGLSVAASVTAKRPTGVSSGSPQQFSADPEGVIPYLVGRAGNAGSIVYRRAWDTANKGDNDRETFVAVISGGGPIHAFDSFTVDGANVSFDSGGAATGGFHNYMWMRTQLGAIPTTTALDFGTGAGSPGDWSSNRRLHGLAAASWTLRYDTAGKLYQKGEPKPTWVAEGVLCYDPRLDSTYPGGSGSHRWADPSNTAAHDAARATWTYTTNPFLHGLKWALGVWERDATDPTSTYVKTFGIGSPWAGVDVDAFVQGANVATVNGWLIGGVIYSGDGRWDTLKKFLQAGMGEPLMLGAKISCFVNAPKVSLTTINKSDFWGKVSVQGTQSRNDRINRVVPRYYQEAQQWQLLPGTPVIVPEYVTEDGGQRSKQIDYPLINNGLQIPVACRYDIENAREFGPITMPLRLRFIGYKPGDVVTVNHDEVGLVSQPVLLLNRDFDPATGIPTFTARSETTAKHAYALGQTSAPPPTPGVSADALTPQPGAGAWAITGTALATGSEPVPALIIEGAIDSPIVEAIVVEYRTYVSGQSADVNWIAAGALPPTATKTVIASVQASAQYEVAISYRRNSAVGVRRILGPATTGAGATRNNPRGAWVSGTEYEVGDTVQSAGSSYECLLAHISASGNTPPNATYWVLLAAGGAPGTDGSTGTTNQLVRIFHRGATAPALPSATVTVNLLSGAVSGLNNGWTVTEPANDGTPCWESAALASSNSGSDTITAAEWPSPVITTGAGVNTFIIEIFRRSAGSPALPTADCTFNFTNGTLTGLNNGWTFGSAPASDGNPCWKSHAVALGVGSTDTIVHTEWPTPEIYVQDGAPGGGGGGGSVPVTPIIGTIGTGSTTPNIVGSSQPYSMTPGDTPIFLAGLITSSGTGTADINVYADYSADPAFGSYSSLGPYFFSIANTDAESVDLDTSYTNSTGTRQVLYWRARTTKSSAGLALSIKMNLQIGGG